MLTPLLILAASAAGQTADPLAEARAGKVQCMTPNRTAKTCMGLVSYTVRPDGTYDSVTTMMIIPAPLVTMEVKSSGTTEGAKVCNIVRKSEFDAAKLVMDGGPVNQAMEQAIRAQMSGSIAPFDGKKACGIDKAEGDVIVAEAFVDGVAHPELNQKYIWVSPSEGYKIGQ